MRAPAREPMRDEGRPRPALPRPTAFDVTEPRADVDARGKAYVTRPWYMGHWIECCDGVVRAQHPVGKDPVCAVCGDLVPVSRPWDRGRFRTPLDRSRFGLRP